MQTKEFLKEMIETPGVSGSEFPVAKVIVSTFDKVCDDVRIDVLGNVIGYKKGEGGGKRPSIMLAGHMDEIGLMVTKIDDEGFLKFTQVGGVDQRTLVAQEVIVHGREDVTGIIGLKPPHLMPPEDRKKAVPMQDLQIDLGLPFERVKKLINVGDVVTVNRSMAELGGDVVTGKALDDRAAVAVIYECLQELKKIKHHADVYAIATTQEEVGLRGAMVSTYNIQPDIGIALDVCHAAMPGVSEQDTAPMGKGPNLAFGANVHGNVFEKLTAIADEYNISFTRSPVPAATGTDLWAMQVVRAGIPTALISIPSRYMHTSVETVSMTDIKLSARLLAYFIASVDNAFVEGLLCY